MNPRNPHQHDSSQHCDAFESNGTKEGPGSNPSRSGQFPTVVKAPVVRAESSISGCATTCVVRPKSNMDFGFVAQ